MDGVSQCDWGCACRCPPTIMFPALPPQFHQGRNTQAVQWVSFHPDGLFGFFLGGEGVRLMLQ